jgi:hypothetical protein
MHRTSYIWHGVTYASASGGPDESGTSPDSFGLAGLLVRLLVDLFVRALCEGSCDVPSALFSGLSGLSGLRGPTLS